MNATTDSVSRVLYTGKTHTTGAREKGVSRSSDGRLDIQLAPPGSSGTGTNPEQLFAAGWSACFEGALALAARRRKIALLVEPSIDAEVDLKHGPEGYFLAARLRISLPGIPRATAAALVEEAHATCPYSKAVRGNIEVDLQLA